MSEPFLRSRTPAGIEVLVQPLSNVRSCSIGFWVRRGSCHELASEEGLAHLIEHAVFKGTERFPDPTAMASATDRLGGHVDAFTGKESACFYGKVLREQVPDLLALLGDLVTSPRFDSEELARERDVVLEEISQSEDQPDDWVSELFYQNFWRGCPVAHSILGRREQVASYGPAEVRAFFQKTYRAPNLMVVAVGDLDASAFLDLLDSTLARIPDGHVSEAHGINTPRPFLLNESRKGLQQTSLVMAFPACAHRHPDRVAANLLAYVLGGGMSSRLFMELREKRALCYQVSSFLTHYEDTGALQISASCSSKRARELVKCALAECVRLASDGVRRDELEQTKLHARTSLVFSQESTAARMFSLAHQAMHMDEIRDLDGLLAEMEAVDLDHLNRVARDILVPERIGLSALGVRKDAEIRPCELES